MSTTSAHRSPLVLRLAVGAIAAAGAAVSLFAATQAGEPITVRFLAVAADGKPVTTIKSDQVSVRVDGKPRNVKSLQFVSFDAAATAAAGPAAKPFETTAPPPYGTNLSEPARLFQLVIDEESIRPGSDRLLKDALDQFVASLPAKDRVGIITLPHGTVKIDPTANHASVRETIPKIAGRAPASRSTSEEQCHTRDVLDELRNLGTMMSSTDEQQTLIFFTLALTASGRASGSTGSASCDLTTTDFQRTGSVIATSRPTVYVVLPETITNTDGIQNLTGVLNGQLLNLQAGSADSALVRIVRETAGYYVATFDSDPNDRNGASHRLELKVAGDGLTVRAPVELTMAKADPKATKPNVKDMVKDTKSYHDMPLRVAGFVSRPKDVKDKVQVNIIVEPADPGAKFSAASVGIADPSGKMSQYTPNAEELAKGTLVTALLMSPGALRIRAAASDASGRAGAADFNLNADLTPAGPLKLSSILIGTGSGAAFQPKLQFRDEPEITVQFFIYAALPDLQKAKGAVELVANPDATDPISVIQFKVGSAGEADAFVATGTLPIDKLAPGDYVVRATMGVEGQPPGRVVRTLRKVK